MVRYASKEERWRKKPRSRHLPAAKAIELGAKTRRTLKCKPNQCQVLSYGGGVDSFTMLLTAIKRGEKPDAVVFVDVADGGPTWESKDPGEWPGTYRHLREVVMPLLKRHGIHFRWLTYRDYAIRGGTPGEARSLFRWFKERGQIPIVKGGAAGATRNCTIIAKVERFEEWLDDHFPGEKVQVWIGFDAEEEDRVKNDPNKGSVRAGIARRINRFPLMEDDLCRCRAVDLIRKAGQAVPRKSACTFCGFGTRKDFQTLKAELPKEFQKVVELERAKEVTGQGMKLSIKGYSTEYQIAGKRITNTGARLYGYDTPAKLWKASSPTGDPTVRKLGRLTVKRVGRPTMLPEFVKQPERDRPVETCSVCGDPRAPKATACSDLEKPPPRGKKLSVITAADLTKPKKPKVRAPTPPMAARKRRKRGDVITADELIAEALGEKF